MVIKYRRPTSASRVGQDMRNTWSHVVGNLATLVLLALAGCLGYLFWPYLPTLAWAQLVAFSLRGLRDRLCADDGPAPRDPEVAPPFLAVLIGRHVGVFSELRSRPPTPRGASGPVGLDCTPDVNLDRKSDNPPRGVCRVFLMPSWTKS